MTWFWWAIVLLAQQGFQLLHTRAKTQDNLWYTAGAGVLSHLAWILSNFFMVDKIVDVKHAGNIPLAVFTVVFYIAFCVVGGTWMQWFAMTHLEKRINGRA